MALKIKLDTLEGLSEDLKKEYKQNVEGKFDLVLDGAPAGGGEDLSGLKAKVQELLDEKKKSDQKRRLAEEEAAKTKADADIEAAKKKGDIEAVTKSLRDMHAAELLKKDEIIKQRDKNIVDITVGAESMNLAAKLAKDPRVIPALLPHIRSMLSVDTSGEMAKTVVLDASGNPTALTLVELENSIKTMPHLQDLIVGSKASGGGNNSGSGGGVPSDLYRDKMTPTQVREFIDNHSQAEYLAIPKSANK